MSHSQVNNHMGVPKDVWGIIEKFSRPKLWWYWCRDPQKFGLTRPGWYDNVMDEFQVIEADSLEQVHFVIYKRQIYRHFKAKQLRLGSHIWEKIISGHSMADSGCYNCRSLHRTIIECRDGNRENRPAISDYCFDHLPSEEALLSACGIADKHHIDQLDECSLETFRHIAGDMVRYRWIEVKPIQW